MSIVFVSRSRITIGTATSSTASSSFSRCWLTLSATNSTSTLTSSRTRTYYHKKFSTCTTTAASHGFIGGGGGDDAAISSAAFARGLKQEEETHDIAAKPFQSPDNSHFFHNGKPTLAYARTLPKTFATMTNDQVIHFGELGLPEACRECIVRDIMMVDGVEYDEAMKVFGKIAKTNREDMPLAALPFYTGVFVSVTAGYVSIPLVFHRGIVEWFNEKYVTAEMPPVEDLETWLEVGSVAWNWMEPVLGQVSFFILCMQMARSQLQNLGIRPYFHWQQERRALKLVRMYPQYDERFLANFSRCDQLAEPRQLSD